MLDASTLYDYFTYQIALIALPLLLYVCMFICMCVAVIFIYKRKNVSIEIFFYIKLFTGSIDTSCLYATQKCCLLYDFAFYSAVSFINHCTYSIPNTFNDGIIKNVVNLKKV